jgi:hypothetical protein
MANLTPTTFRSLLANSIPPKAASNARSSSPFRTKITLDRDPYSSQTKLFQINSYNKSVFDAYI